MTLFNEITDWIARSVAWAGTAFSKWRKADKEIGTKDNIKPHVGRKSQGMSPSLFLPIMPPPPTPPLKEVSRKYRIEVDNDTYYPQVVITYSDKSEEAKYIYKNLTRDVLGGNAYFLMKKYAGVISGTICSFNTENAARECIGKYKKSLESPVKTYIEVE